MCFHLQVPSISNSSNLENGEFALRVLSGCIRNCYEFGFGNAKPYSCYLQREGCKGTGADKPTHKILLQQSFSKIPFSEGLTSGLSESGEGIVDRGSSITWYRCELRNTPARHINVGRLHFPRKSPPKSPKRNSPPPPKVAFFHGKSTEA